jgi:hypothetical protein
MDIFYVIHHMGDALLIRIPFVTDAKYALRLVADKGDLHGRKGGEGPGLSSLKGASQAREGHCF